MDNTRRSFLALAGLAPLALVATRAAAAGARACPDPAALPPSQQSRRRILAYVEVAADETRRCGTCAFFTAGSASSGCGTCQLLPGGPVSAIATCNSFAPRA